MAKSGRDIVGTTGPGHPATGPGHTATRLEHAHDKELRVRLGLSRQEVGARQGFSVTTDFL